MVSTDAKSEKTKTDRKYGKIRFSYFLKGSFIVMQTSMQRQKLSPREKCSKNVSTVLLELESMARALSLLYEPKTEADKSMSRSALQINDSVPKYSSNACQETIACDMRMPKTRMLG